MGNRNRPRFMEVVSAAFLLAAPAGASDKALAYSGKPRG